MENLIINDYGQFKEMFNTEIKSASASFVRMGYLIKFARDTDILEKSGYKTPAEFAEKEYGLSPSTVSRFIKINDKYSKNGYSYELDEKYENYGQCRLEEMITLPDYIADEITADHTIKQIREIKKEIREENEITDIEVMCEEKQPITIECRNIFEQTMYKWLSENADKYQDLIDAARLNSVEALLDVMAPSGVETLSCRIPGTGKMMVFIKGKDEDVVTMNVRTGEKEIYTWQQVAESILYMFADKKREDVYPKKVEIATSQQKYNEEQIAKEPEQIVENNTEFNPEPEQMESICYKCLHWKQCDEKSTITTQCNEFVNKAEMEKTEEQKYNEEQDAIDHETAKILREKADKEKLEHLPSETDLRKIHKVKIANECYNDVASRKKTFELLKNDRDFKVGDGLEMEEFKKGQYTGRCIKANITYMLEDYTGLAEDYCILGIEVEKDE